MRRSLASAAAVVAAAAPLVWAGDRAPDTLVQLRPAAACTQTAFLARHGARLVSRPLRLWLVPASSASSVLGSLRRDGALAFSEPNRVYAHASVAATAARRDYGDPLVPFQWWRTAIGVADLTPPGPGVPVTIVDSGVDFTHEEFSARPNLVAINAQEPTWVGGRHGTMVASVVAAPVNGKGLVGIYPDAFLRSYDAAVGDGNNLATAEIVNGILAGSQVGRGVINLSLGGSSRSLSIEQAVYAAVRRGSLVVAASGNSGEDGSPLEYPAAVPHVLTVAATDRADEPAPFSSRSGYVDLAAPGVEMEVARPASLGGPYAVESGTSFAAPLVSGAAAWIWTVRPDLDASQVAEILRRSARDLGTPGWDNATGYGMLDVAAALAYPTPTPDPGEPNDDITNADPTSNEFAGFAPMTTAAQSAAATAGRLTRLDDPRDVFRLWLPRNQAVAVTVQADKPVTVQVYRRGDARSVTGRGGTADRIASIGRPTAEGTLRVPKGLTGRVAFLSIGMPNGGGRDIAYAVTVYPLR